jgi:hypothetical protein
MTEDFNEPIAWEVAAVDARAEFAESPKMPQAETTPRAVYFESAGRHSKTRVAIHWHDRIGGPDSPQEGCYESCLAKTPGRTVRRILRGLEDD